MLVLTVVFNIVLINTKNKTKIFFLIIILVAVVGKTNCFLVL